MTDSQLVKLVLRDRVAHVILDRPEHNNRFTAEMMLEFINQLHVATAKADLLIVGSSSADFTLGRDQGEQPSGMTREHIIALILEANRLLTQFQGLTIAAINGRALGFGSGVVVQSDVVVAGESSVFGFDEVSHGSPPMIVMTYLGDHLLRKHVNDLVLTGRLITADEALRLGIVTRVVPDEQVDATVNEYEASLRGATLAAAMRAKRYLSEIREIPVAERPSYALRQQIAWLNRPN